METFSYEIEYSLVGIKRHGRKPSKRDLPEQFVDLLERMGFEIGDSSEHIIDNCLRIGYKTAGNVGSEIARVDFNKGIVIAKQEELRLDMIRPLGLKELPPQHINFKIPGTYGGGSMVDQSDIDERIPKFRDYLRRYSFLINVTGIDSPKVKKRFAKEISGELWSNCITVFPNIPWGSELYRLCLDYS